MGVLDRGVVGSQPQQLQSQTDQPQPDQYRDGPDDAA
jgi:hypothetical protein